MMRSESRASLTCISEVHTLIRGDLFSMQYKIVSSEITGGVPVHKYPGTDKECPALSVRYETGKRGTRLRRRQTGNEDIRRHAE